MPLKRLKRGHLAGALAVWLACLLICSCRQGRSLPINPSNPGPAVNAPLAPFNGHFQVPAGALNPVAPQDPAILDKSTYWMAAGDTIPLTWDDYSLSLPCQKTGADPDSQPSFPYNLCDPNHGCTRGGQVIACQVQIPSMADSKACASDNPIYLVGDSMVVVPPNTDAHYVGINSALNVWALQFPCTNGNCSVMMAPSKSSSWLWALGCSPTTVSAGLDIDANMGGDALLQMWASARVDFPQNHPPQADDQAGPTLNVSAVAPGTPRRDPNRVRFIEQCGPDRSSCNSASDSSESQWGPDAASSSTEVFSSKLRVREVRVFATPTDADPMNPQTMAFCSAYQAGDRRDTESGSNCDASSGMQTGDCSAAAKSNVSPRSPWKITFSDKPQNNNAPSKCPNSSGRTEIWVEFSLEVKP